MPPRRQAPARRGRPSKPRHALMSHPRRRMLYNPQPVFTETYKLVDLLPNAGFLLSTNIGQLPQLAQYNGLYQKYRILKAVFQLFPTWTGGEAQNQAIYNQVSGPGFAGGGVSSAGTSRMVSVIDDSPDQSAPASEAEVLQENGCKIRFLDKMAKLVCRPAPDLKDSNGAQLTIKKRFINFSPSNPNVNHYGIRGWITHPFNIGGTAFNVPDTIRYTVYCKLTFQLADPR